MAVVLELWATVQITVILTYDGHVTLGGFVPYYFRELLNLWNFPPLSCCTSSKHDSHQRTTLSFKMRAKWRKKRVRRLKRKRRKMRARSK
ncbi:hypothetical protein ACCO45_011630 [Purpureocillium lilacinum]|uniref:Uncharacterized protein n=1 Tax=Purpureocillium lilacinum TaxID=33203 RepID=A0ACC4DBM9_PURLI